MQTSQAMASTWVANKFGVKFIDPELHQLKIKKIMWYCSFKWNVYNSKFCLWWFCELLSSLNWLVKFKPSHGFSSCEIDRHLEGVDV